MQSSEPKRQFNLSHYLVLLGIIIATFFIVALSVFNDSLKVDISEMAYPKSTCDVQQQRCVATFLDGTEVTLSLSPAPVEPIKPFDIQVSSTRPNILAVKVDFRGINVGMGYYRPKLGLVSESDYKSEGILSACAVDKMVWEATVILETADGIFAAPFQFTAVGKN